MNPFSLLVPHLPIRCDKVHTARSGKQTFPFLLFFPSKQKRNRSPTPHPLNAPCFIRKTKIPTKIECFQNTMDGILISAIRIGIVESLVHSNQLLEVNHNDNLVK